VRLRSVVPEGLRVYAKVESFNPGGSVKDRIGLAMIEDAERKGLLKPGGTIVEGTSGNTGVGLALVARLKGYRIIFTMPDKMAVEKERLLRAYGAEVVRSPSNVASEDPRSYYSVAARLAKEIPGAHYPNQYTNTMNPIAHERTTGPEIWDDTDGKITHFVCGVGTGGTISGTSKFLKSKNAAIRTIGVDPKGSVLAGVKRTGVKGEAKPYTIEGIGQDNVPACVWFDTIDEFVTVQDEESHTMTRRLAEEEGLLCGSSSGAAVVGVVRAHEQGLIPTDALTVVLLPDTGERYLSKVYEPGWLRAQKLMPPARTAGEACVSPLPHVLPEEPVARIFFVARARDVPVLAVMTLEGRVLGMVRVDDIVAELLDDEKAMERTADTFAVEAPPKVDIATPLGAAAATLRAHEALIVTQSGKPYGLLTRRMALAHLGRI
jgi:cystathionine beta-synthase